MSYYPLHLTLTLVQISFAVYRSCPGKNSKRVTSGECSYLVNSSKDLISEGNLGSPRGYLVHVIVASFCGSFVTSLIFLLRYYLTSSSQVSTWTLNQRSPRRPWENPSASLAGSRESRFRVSRAEAESPTSPILLTLHCDSYHF